MSSANRSPTAPCACSSRAEGTTFRPAARAIRLSLLSATSLFALFGGSAEAQSVWNGATGDYNTNANWTSNVAPIMAGQAAVFGNTGTPTIALSNPVAPDSWTFNAGAQAYAITGAGVSFGGSGIANNAASAISIASDVGGTGGLAQAGAGTLTLSGTNTYTGATQVTAGTLVAVSDGGFSATSAYTVNGGTLQVNAASTAVGSLAGTGGAVFLNQGFLSVGADNTSTTFAGTVGAFNGAGITGLTKVGTGTLALTGSANGDVVFLTEVQGGTLASSGGYATQGLTIDGGTTVRAGANGGINANAVTLYDTGVLDLANFNLTVGSLSSLSTAGSTPTSSPPSTDASIALGTGTLTILGNPGLNLGGVSEHDFAGVIAGAGGVTLTGGAATLSGANTYSGPTILSGGILTVSSASGSGPTITPLGSGVLTFDGGTLQAGGTYSLANNAVVNGAGGTIDTNGPNVLELFGTIGNGNATTGNLSIVDTSGRGQGVVFLSGANTFSGGVTLNVATLFVDPSTTMGGPGAITSSSLGTGTLTFAGGTLEAFRSGTIANDVVLNPAGQNTAAGVISSDGNMLSLTGTISNAFAGANGGGALFINDANGGTVMLSGDNTYTGGTVIQAGTLQVGADSVVANGVIASSAVGTGPVELSGGVLQTSGNRSLANAIFVDAAGGTIDAFESTFTLSGTVANGLGTTGTLTIDNTGDGPGVVVLSGSSTYTGPTIVTQPAGLRAGSATAFAAASDFTVDGFLDLNNFSNQIGSLSGSGRVRLGSGTLTVGNDTDTAFSGSISGGGGLVKVGADQLVLSGINTYTGATAINAGALVAGADNALSAASATSVATGGTLDLGGFAQTVNAVTLSGGVLQNGALTGAVTSTGGGIFTLSGPAMVSVTDGVTLFAGANTYSGATAITGGAVTANNADAFSAASSTSVAAGGTLDLGGFAQTIDAVALNGGVLQNGALTGAITSTGGSIADLSGPASVTTSGGTTALFGTNTYTGATAINGGTVVAQGTDALSPVSATSIGAGGILQLQGFDQTLNGLSGSGLVINGASTPATLTIANGTDEVPDFAGQIADGGAASTRLAIAQGTQVLSGANTYTGGTAISGSGALVVGAGGTSGSILGNVANDGILAFNRSDLYAFAGAITGAGSVYQLGGGTTIFTADHSYTGGTLVLGGTLQVGNGGTTGSLVGDVLDNATLAFNRSDVHTFEGAISGTGAVRQDGSGTLVLTGDSTYTGATIVNAGTLTVNGSIVSPTQVLSGATLNGAGTVGDITVGNGGTLSPGTPGAIGVLGANGGVTFQPGSTFAIRATSANQNDILLATGAANLSGGTVRVLASGSNFAPDTRYLILNAAGQIASPFAGVTTNLAFLTPTLSYDANNVFLDLGGPQFTVNATTPTEMSVGNALQSGFGAGATGAGAELLADVENLSASQAPTALAQLSGQALTAAQETSFAAGKIFMSTLDNQAQSWLAGDLATGNAVVLREKPLAYAATVEPGTSGPFASIRPPDPAAPARTWRAWGSGFNAAQTLKDTGGSTLDLTHRTSGGAFGADYQVNPFLLAGFAVGGSESSFAVPHSFTSGHLQGAHAGVYAAGKLGAFYATAALTYAHFTNNTTRQVTAVGPIQTELGHFGSDQAGGSFEFGYRRDVGPVTVTPFASVAFYDTFQQSVAETGPAGALYGLNVGARDSSSVPLSFGVQVDGRVAFDNGWVLAPYLRASYQHETIRHRDLDAFFSAVPLSFFTAQGIVADADVADIKTGVRLWMSPTASLFANFEGQLSDRTRGYAVTAGLSFLPSGDTTAIVAANDVADTPWTKSATQEVHVDAFRSSRGYPASSSLGAGGGFQIYSATTFQASGTILPNVRLDLVAKPGFVYARQTTVGLSGSIATPTDTTAAATFTYLALDGIQPFLSLNTNLPSGTTVLKGSRANARMDPDFVSVGTFGEGLNIGPTLGVNLPFNESLTASLSVGYTHRGSYDKEGPISLATFAQGTQVFAPGSDVTLSANVGYVAAPFTTQASFSYAKESVTYTDASPSFQAGDRFIGSLTEGYAWSEAINTSFTGTVSYSAKNQVLDTNLPAFLSEAFNSNGLVARLRLDQSFIHDQWTLNPFAAFVYRDRNGYDPVFSQFVPAKSIYSGGLTVRRAVSDTASISGSLEYFRSHEVANPATTVGGVQSDGLHAVVTGSLVF